MLGRGASAANAEAPPGRRTVARPRRRFFVFMISRKRGVSSRRCPPCRLPTQIRQEALRLSKGHRVENSGGPDAERVRVAQRQEDAGEPRLELETRPIRRLLRLRRPDK